MGLKLTSSTDPALSALGYDAHGNTVALGAEALGYDGADRHTTTVTGTTTVRYTRDATDREPPWESWAVLAYDVDTVAEM